jgi:hypothetical protein
MLSFHVSAIKKTQRHLFLIFHLFSDLVKIQNNCFTLNGKLFEPKKMFSGLLQTTQDLLNFEPLVEYGKFPIFICGDDVRLNYLLFLLMKNADERNRKNLTTEQSITKSVKMTVTIVAEQEINLDESGFTSYNAE